MQSWPVGTWLRSSPRTDRDYERKLTGEDEAHLIALACSDPPDGRHHWTLRLLADELAEGPCHAIFHAGCSRSGTTGVTYRLDECCVDWIHNPVAALVLTDKYQRYPAGEDRVERHRRRSTTAVAARASLGCREYDATQRT